MWSGGGVGVWPMDGDKAGHGLAQQGAQTAAAAAAACTRHTRLGPAGICPVPEHA